MHSAILAFALITGLFAANHAFAQEQVVLQAPSDQETFTVEITWTPNDLGSAHSFDIRFIEPETEEEVEDMRYDFSIYMGDDRQVIRRNQAETHQEFTFDETGPYEIRIDNIDGLDEGVAIPIQVTPEFPFGVLVLAGAVGAAMLVARRNSNNLFRLHNR